MRKALELISLRFRRTWPVMLGLAVFATGLGYVWYHFDLLELSDDERNAYDDGVKKFTGKDWFPWGKVKRAEDIIVVAIDDKTFIDVKTNPQWVLRYGAWPYDRVIYADAFEYLHDSGAKLIVFDATVDESKPDPTGDLALGQTVKDKGIPLYLGFNVIPKVDPLPRVTPVNHPPVKPAPPAPAPSAVDAGDVAADADAGATAEEFPAEEEFPSGDEFPSDDAPKAEDPAKKAARLERVATLYAFPVETRGGLELPKLEPVATFDDNGQRTGELDVHPVPAIEPMLDSVSGWGLVLVEEDEDGKMRQTRFAYTDGANTYVTLPVAAAADALGADKVILEPGKLTIGSRVIPINADGSAWIDYGGPLGARYRSISLIDVLRARNRPEMAALFKDKYVFVGGFALGTGDVKATPLETRTPGISKQLAVFEGLMHRGFIIDAPLWVSILFTFFVCFFSVALVLIVRNVFVDIGWPVLLYAGFFIVTGSLLVLTKVHILSAMPGFAGTVASVLATAWDRLFANQERERMKEMFKSYMETDLVDRMVEGKELPKLDGDLMRVTAFFSDIKGFSTFSEALKTDPKRLMRLLNRYLSTVTPALTAEGACIDKYIGDAVVALFGAPITHADHALRACRGALNVQKALTTLRAELAKEGLPDVYTRVGLNTDTMLVGNIGSDQLLDYTAIGDGMNLAARLEATNKHYDTLILMGENTYLEVRSHVVAREVDAVRVAGKHQVTRIYELLGLKGEVDARTLKVVQQYERALAMYRDRRFEQAAVELRLALNEAPNDGPSHVLLKRCEHHQMSPPPPDWDGATSLEK
ncbi:MAG: adenylate/guanylate cyclase domain-containing protein [Myxococcota bacterium]